MEEVNMMLWMKCRHVSTSRAPVWAHYLLSELFLHYKNLPSAEMQNCKACSHAGAKDKDNRRLYNNKDYLIIFDSLCWWWLSKLPKSCWKCIAKGNSIENWGWVKMLHLECDATAVMHTSLYRHNTHCLHQPKNTLCYYQQILHKEH